MAQHLLADLDGRLHDISAPFVRADDLGIVRGDGVFDATLVRGGRVRDLTDHIERLARSAKILGLPEPDAEGFVRASEALVAAWDFRADPEAMLRLVLTRGPELGGAPTSFASLSPLATSAVRERETGVRVVVLDRGHDGAAVASMPWLLPGAKSLSYSINMAAKRYAVDHGADDALFVAANGQLLEGPTSTLVVDVDGALLTPPQDGILDSITLAHLLREAPQHSLDVRYAPLTVSDLLRSRGAWLVSSGRLAAAITSVDGAALPRSPLHESVRAALGIDSDH